MGLGFLQKKQVSYHRDVSELGHQEIPLWVFSHSELLSLVYVALKGEEESSVTVTVLLTRNPKIFQENPVKCIGLIGIGSHLR